MARQDWSVGDIIYSPRFEVYRELTEKRLTGYTWKYPDIEGKDWLSENSGDPFFEWGWVKVNDFEVTPIHAVHKKYYPIIEGLWPDLHFDLEEEPVGIRFRLYKSDPQDGVMMWSPLNTKSLEEIEAEYAYFLGLCKKSALIARLQANSQ